ncbi:hypothetical protein ACHAQA_000473 [Verticillium albo-atrum]
MNNMSAPHLGPQMPKYVLTPNSRNGRPTVRRMPSIAEDGQQQPQYPQQVPARPPHRRASSLPVTPRRPQRHRPARYRSSSTGATGPQKQPQQYTYFQQLQNVPPYPPPSYYPRHSKEPLWPSPLRNSVAWDSPDREAAAETKGRREKLRENEWVARRGGWCRIGLIMLFFIMVVVGLAVGLTLGLRKDNNDAPAPSASPAPYPAGSFAFQTALTTASSDCTSDPSTWRCPPFTTHAEDPSAAGATFFWTIVAPDADADRPEYTVSSAENPFAPRFRNVSMTLLDGNTANERLEFELEMERDVVPGNNTAVGATCTYDTVFKGVVWTGRVEGDDRNRTSMADAGDEVAGGDWREWPGEVEIEQTSRQGPDCREGSGAVIPVEAGDGECSCRYANYGLDDARRRRRSRVTRLS